MSNYLDTVNDVYAKAALEPDASLCCTSTPPWKLPGLVVPKGMLERNYGCGSTVSPRDLADARKILYVGVGAGLEVLQMAYFVRQPGGVIAVDTVPEMLDIAGQMLDEAVPLNPWFTRDMVSLRKGDALALPIEDGTIDVAAQNCLFNVFTREHLDVALSEMFRVLRPGGALVLSDPVATEPIPERLANDHRLRAQCLSGALPLDEYLDHLVKAGFGTIEVRSRRPYRVLDRRRHELPKDLLLETVEVVARRDAVPADGPCIFTGRTAIYVGNDEVFDDDKGHMLRRDVPLGVCDKTANALGARGGEDIIITPSTWLLLTRVFFGSRHWRPLTPATQRG
jgi:ubiquinone/menaquinone biosynthesis C-methylase UbiE